MKIFLSLQLLWVIVESSRGEPSAEALPFLTERDFSHQLGDEEVFLTDEDFPERGTLGKLFDKRNG